MKKSYFLLHAVLGLLLLTTLYSCQQSILHEDAAAISPAYARDTRVAADPSSLGPTSCEIPVIRDLRVSSTCVRNEPCTNQPVMMQTTVNCIRWRVGSDCGNYYYNNSNGTPVYQLYRFVGIASGTQCERFSTVGGAFTCSSTQQFMAVSTLLNNTRYFLAVSNAPITTSNIYKDPFGYYHAGSCTDNTTWDFTDFIEFTTTNGKGLQCMNTGPSEQPL